MQKISTLTGIIIIIVAVVVLLGGVFAWQYYNVKSETQNPKSETNSNIQTTGWTTYTNSQYGFSVDYPPEATLKDFGGGGYEIFLNKEDMGGQNISINIISINGTHGPCSVAPIDPMDSWGKTASVNIGEIAFDHFNNSKSDSYNAVVNGECWQIYSSNSNQLASSVLNTFKFSK